MTNLSSSSKLTILVTCASGATGREVVKRLNNTNQFIVRAGVRDIEKAKKMFGSLENVEIVKLDETDANSSAAFSGAHAVYLIIAEPSPSDPCFPMWLKHTKLAKLQHVVFHSNVSANKDDPVLLDRITFQQQEEIRESGIDYTYLRPTFFHQNTEKYLMPNLHQGFFTGSSNGGSYTSVDVRDIADVAVVVFQDLEKHRGKSYPLTTEVITDEKTAEILSKALKRTIKYNDLPAEQYSAELTAAGLPADIVQAIIELEKEKERNSSLPIRNDLVLLLGRNGITYEEYVNQIVAPSFTL